LQDHQDFLLRPSTTFDFRLSTFTIIFSSALARPAHLPPPTSSTGATTAAATAASRRDELCHEQEKFKAISEELDQTFAEMSGY
jgi:hypothetical protein